MADGKGCKCGAYSYSECACDADWTPQELINARSEIKLLKEEIESLKNRLFNFKEVAYARVNERGDLYDLRTQCNPYLDPNTVTPLYRFCQAPLLDKIKNQDKLSLKGAKMHILIVMDEEEKEHFFGPFNTGDEALDWGEKKFVGELSNGDYFLMATPLIDPTNFADKKNLTVDESTNC